MHHGVNAKRSPFMIYPWHLLLAACSSSVALCSSPGSRSVFFLRPAKSDMLTAALFFDFLFFEARCAGPAGRLLQDKDDRHASADLRALLRQRLLEEEARQILDLLSEICSEQGFDSARHRV